MFLFEWKLGCCLRKLHSQLMLIRGGSEGNDTFFGDQNSLQLLRQEDVKCTFFAPGGWRLCTTTLHFLDKFFVDFNRTTFISSCFRGGMKRANTVGYALALTGSGPSFMFPHRNIVVSFSVSRQSNVFTFQPSSTKAKVEGKYPPYGKLKDLRF